MAERYRLKTLTDDERGILESFESQFPGSINYFETTGKLHPDVQSMYEDANSNPEVFGLPPKSDYNKIKYIVLKLPSQKEAYKKYVFTRPSDISTLDDEELKNYITAYEGILGEGVLTQRQVKERLKELFTRKYGEANVSELNFDDLSKSIVEDKHYGIDSTNKAFKNLFTNIDSDDPRFQTISNDANEIVNQVRSEHKESQSVEDATTNLNIKTIRDILADRVAVASSKAQAGQFLATAPDELATAREGFFSGQRKRATDYLANEFLPTTIEDLGVSGRPMSFAGDILASKAGELESTIAQHQSEQEASDAALFADMAYQKTFQDLIDARADVSAKVGYERANLKQTQAQGFQSRQSDIQRNFDLSLFEKENADALKAYKTKLNTASSKAKSASEANTWSALGQTAAQVGGSVIASKIPGVIG